MSIYIRVCGHIHTRTRPQVLAAAMAVWAAAIADLPELLPRDGPAPPPLPPPSAPGGASPLGAGAAAAIAVAVVAAAAAGVAWGVRSRRLPAGLMPCVKPAGAPNAYIAAVGAGASSTRGGSNYAALTPQVAVEGV